MTTLPESALDYDVVLLLGFGGPNGPDDIRPFLDRILKGRHIPHARYEAVVAHYMELGGRSPYNELTQRQADGIARRLGDFGIDIPVEVAYRNAEPFIDMTMRRLAQNKAKNIFCIVLAPHQSAASWEKYVVSLENAREWIGPTAPRVDYVPPYFDHPLFVSAHAERVKHALARLGRAELDTVEVIFTAHSIPQETAGSDMYVEQFYASAELIAQAVGARSWSVGYQSRSGSPGERWLEPDIRDILRQLPGRGVREAVVAPIGFLCDHIEVLYDLDIDAKNVARDAGVRIERAQALNDHPLFVQMLAELAIAGMRQGQAIQV